MGSLHGPDNPFPKRRYPYLITTTKKIFGFLVLYLKSTIFVQMDAEFKLYLKIQELNRAMFKLLKSGIPNPPISFF
jgi:hypothetical protein